MPNLSPDDDVMAQSHSVNTFATVSHRPKGARKGLQQCASSVIRHSNFEGVGHQRCCTPARVISTRDEGSRGPPANGRLTPSRIGGVRESGAASDCRRQSSPPSSTDKPSRLRPSAGCPAGSLRRPRFGYRAQGRRPITSLATAVGVTSLPSLSTLALFSHPFDHSHHRLEIDDSELLHLSFPFPASSLIRL